MADKMLIDASHEEETRVVVVRGNRIEEFDFESQHKKQLRGNIYLAKVTRVEPSLQAAFVDYGGNRHGFLAFSEIHPDYYQIPLADRQALLAAEAEAEAERARNDDDEDDDEDATAAQAKSESDHDDDEAGEEGKSKSSRGRGRSRRGRGAKKDAAKAQSDDADDQGGDDPQSDADDGHEDGDGPDAGGGGTGDDDGNDPSTPKSMAAMVDADEVSEPAGERRDRNDEENVDPGEVDYEAAQHVEGVSEDGRPAEAVVRENDGKVEPASGTGDDDNGASDDDDDDDDSDGDGDGEENGSSRRGRRARGRGRKSNNGRRKRSDDEEDDSADGNGENGGRVESVGAEDALEEVPDRSVRKPRKQYRIQEVIKRRQILLVQVVKEERGNKGAALTTYLSLAGRYSVLMPNTARGGGISRKITNIADRKRLKEIAKGLEVPQGMGVILRTAGANRTKAEIKRDFEYLMRLWENVRNLTLASTAPCLVYEEGSLIKRSIRDLYNKDISEVIVSGEEGYREAKDFMKMLMPSHAKVVQPYREVHPIFSRSGIEAQLDRMLQPQVTLKSGGYIIINQTEALVAIDVNSGRSTKEHSIEDTALQTNLEAADEVARQLRLRDLAGLIVVDFIDMEEKRNNRSVEKRLKDALKNDRARIQVGRISHFGLLEMSRQRIRASVLESTTQVCEHCGGTGHVRSQSSVALHVIRSIEEFLLKSTTHDIVVRTRPDTALYVLNQKRDTITEMEKRFGVTITVEADTSIGSSHLAIDRGAAVESPVKIEDLVQPGIEPDADDASGDVSWDDEAEDQQPGAEERNKGNGDSGQQDGKRKRRRRRRGGRDRSDEGDNQAQSAPSSDDDHESDDDADESSDGNARLGSDSENGERPKKRRRRGKRGGRRNRQNEEDGVTAKEPDESAGSQGDEQRSQPEAVEAAEEPTAATAQASTDAQKGDADAQDSEPAPEKAEAKPKRAPRRRKAKPAEPQLDEAQANAEADAEDAVSGETGQSDPVPATADIADQGSDEADKSEPSAPADPVVISNGEKTGEAVADEKETKPKKVGWWQRRSFF